MYAVIKSGGKQYKVAKGDKIKVEKLDAEEGKSITLSEVLMVADGEQVSVGSPYLENARVTARVEGHGRSAKINIIKFKRRKNHRKQMGHRQAYTDLAITDVALAQTSEEVNNGT